MRNGVVDSVQTLGFSLCRTRILRFVPTLFGLGKNQEAITNYRFALELARKSYSTADVVDILNNI